MPGFKPWWIFSTRVHASSSSTSYFDTTDGTTKTDSVIPWSLAAAGGVFFGPKLLLAASFSYGRARKTNTPGLLCTNVNVNGAPTVPATSACASDIVIGAPTWLQQTTLRVEVRRYLFGGLIFDPAFSYIWSGSNATLFNQNQGAWQMEIPLYLTLKSSSKPATAAGGSSGTSAAPPPSLALGVSYLHKETWGLGAANVSSDDGNVFLGGSFDMNTLLL